MILIRFKRQFTVNNSNSYNRINEKTMADLWGALDEPEPLETVSLPVAVRTPDVVVKQDLINHDNIRHQTEQLRISLDCSAQIAVAAYKVADYIPNLRDSKYREFWEVQVCI